MVSSPWAKSAATVASAAVIETVPGTAVFPPGVEALVICPGFRSEPAPECADRRRPVEGGFALVLARLDKRAPACAFPRDISGSITTMHRYRSHTCGELRAADIGREARLSGWCHRIRDHGGLLFIDLRDHYGITQCVPDPDSPVFKEIEMLRSEWVVGLDGKERPPPPD